MPVRQLEWHALEKVWGRRDFPRIFGDAIQFTEAVGEIWFEDGRERPLLVKRLFTSQKLSIQVHPTDEQARAAGHPRGKDEAWYVLSAEPGAVIGAGFETGLSPSELRSCAMDGSIDALLKWHPVKPGDFFYVPAGTVHAIGAGLSVLEIQQNVDLTYRLFDYGRPRELQLEEGLAAAKPGPLIRGPNRAIDASRDLLVEGPKFVIERLRGSSEQKVSASADNPVWLMPITDGCKIDGVEMPAGTVWLAEGPAQVQLESGDCLLAAYAGDHARQ